MSVYLFVYLRDNRLPTRAAWQAAIDADNLKLTLGDFDPRDFDGLLPCQLDGIDCGFEYYFDSLDEDDQELQDRIADCDRVVSLIIHGGQMRDLSAAMYAAAALTQVTGGVFYDRNSDQSASGRGVYDLMRQHEEAEQERRRLVAEKDAALNDRTLYRSFGTTGRARHNVGNDYRAVITGCACVGAERTALAERLLLVVGAAAASERQYVMQRKLDKLATLLCAVLCASTGALWVRGCFRQDAVTRGRWALLTGRGNLIVEKWEIRGTRMAQSAGRQLLDWSLIPGFPLFDLYRSARR